MNKFMDLAVDTFHACFWTTTYTDLFKAMNHSCDPN